MAFRVLIVDDQKDVSRLLRSALETIEQGLSVAEAPSGEEAMLELSKGKIDLLVTDYRLPGMNGLELLEKIRARNPEVSVIVVSGVADAKTQTSISNANVNQFFTKPVPVGDFLAAVETLLGLARTVVTETEKEEKQVEERRTFADTLADLRASLNGHAVLLINTDAKIEAEAGEAINKEKLNGLIPTFISIHAAAQKISANLSNHLHLFVNQEEDIVLVPVSNTYALLVTGKDLAGTSNLPKTLGALQLAINELIEAMLKMGVLEAEVNSQELSSEPLKVEPVDATAEDFAKQLFNVNAKKQEADNFWDTLVEKGTTYNEPDKLTYDQASKLGLTPDETVN